MFRPALALLALVVSSVALAAPAQAASYAVTLTASHVSRDVGQTLTLTGKVTGSKAAKKKLTVQRRVGSGSWTTIGSARTTSTKAYSFKHRVSRVGAQSFRVLAPKNGSTKTGTSPSRAVTGWTWLNLTDQPHYTEGAIFFGTTARVEENVYPRSIELTRGAGTRAVYWQLDGQCDASDVDVALNDTSEGTQPVFVATDDGGTTKQAVAGSLTGANVVSTASGSLSYEVTGTTEHVLVISPRLHCKVARLAEPTY